MKKSIRAGAVAAAVLLSATPAMACEFTGVPSDYVRCIHELADAAFALAEGTAARLDAPGLTFPADCGDRLCTPLECLDLCRDDGRRLATEHDVLAWLASSAGHDRCTHSWVMSLGNPGQVLAPNPMVSEVLVRGGCGPEAPAGPRLVGGELYEWDTPVEYTCTCALP